jgi:hypothetical protein
MAEMAIDRWFASICVARRRSTLLSHRFMP